MSILYLKCFNASLAYRIGWYKNALSTCYNTSMICFLSASPGSCLCYFSHILVSPMLECPLYSCSKVPSLWTLGLLLFSLTPMWCTLTKETVTYVIQAVSENQLNDWSHFSCASAVMMRRTSLFYLAGPRRRMLNKWSRSIPASGCF